MLQEINPNQFEKGTNFISIIEPEIEKNPELWLLKMVKLKMADEFFIPMR